MTERFSMLLLLRTIEQMKFPISLQPILCVVLEFAVLTVDRRIKGPLPLSGG